MIALETLRTRIEGFRNATAARGIAVGDSTSAIQPVLAGAPERAVAWSQALLARGFLVPAIRPPTVPEGTSRLRISISAAHAQADIEALVAALAQVIAS